MAANIRSRKATTRRARRSAQMSEINITPFVDVMLVLLVIFMVTAPLMTTGIEVDLPKTQSAPISGQDEPLIISVQDSQNVFIGKSPIETHEIAVKLQAILGEKFDTRIFIQGARTANYGDVVQVMSAVQNAGFSKVALITAQED